jgi:hypothetical protein
MPVNSFIQYENLIWALADIVGVELMLKLEQKSVRKLPRPLFSAQFGNPGGAPIHQLLHLTLFRFICFTFRHEIINTYKFESICEDGVFNTYKISIRAIDSWPMLSHKFPTIDTTALL